MGVRTGGSECAGHRKEHDATAREELADGERLNSFVGTPEERVKRMTEQLGLTPEQAEKIKAIYEKGAEANKALREKGFNNLTDEEKTKMRDSMKAQQDEIAAILTPEQKKKQEEARGQRGGPGGGRRGGGAAPGAPAGAPAAPGK